MGNIWICSVRIEWCLIEHIVQWIVTVERKIGYEFKIVDSKIFTSQRNVWLFTKLIWRVLEWIFLYSSWITWHIGGKERQEKRGKVDGEVVYSLWQYLNQQWYSAKYTGWWAHTHTHAQVILWTLSKYRWWTFWKLTCWWSRSMLVREYLDEDEILDRSTGTRWAYTLKFRLIWIDSTWTNERIWTFQQ